MCAAMSAFSQGGELLGPLLAAGAHVDCRKEGGVPMDAGATALHLAARLGRTQAVRDLVLAGAAVDLADDRGDTPLW